MKIKPVISVNGLFQSYNGRPVLKNICRDFYPGSVTLITGNNGSGKSTLLRLLAGFIKPDKGSIFYNEDFAPAYLGHDAFCYPNLTALENLEFWCKLGRKKIKKADLEEKLANFGLLKFANSPVKNFSRGMLQKLHIVRLELLDSGARLLDEPATGLDSQSKIFLHELIRKWREQNMCIILVSHDISQDAVISDAILEIANHVLRSHQLSTSFITDKSV